MVFGVGENVTKREYEVLSLLIDGIFQKEIASRLKITKQRVSQIVKNLIKKGHLNSYEKVLLTRRGTLPGNIHKSILEKNKTWRTEAYFFMVNIYYKFPKYYKIMKERANYGIPEGLYTIMLYEDYVRIQTKKGVFFRGVTKEEAIQKGEEAFDVFLVKASEKYGFHYYKEGRASITLNSMELAEEDGKLGVNVKKITNKSFVMFKDHNNKGWLKIDISHFPIIDTEYIGRNTINNVYNLEPYLKDMTFNKPLTNSELGMRLNDVITALEKITKKIS